MDFLTTLLARVFEAFKQKSPKVAAAILLVLGALVYFADKGTLLGIFSLPEWAAEAVKYVGVFLGYVTSTRTVAFLPAEKRSEREQEYLSKTVPELTPKGDK